jgi:hypothetical protein
MKRADDVQVWSIKETAAPITAALVPFAHVHKEMSGGILRHFSLSSNMTLRVSGAGTLSRSLRRGAQYWGMWWLNDASRLREIRHRCGIHMRGIPHHLE